MEYIDIITGDKILDLSSQAKFQIKKRGSYLCRYTSIDQYELIVKIIIDNNGREYPCISAKTIKMYLGENVGRKFDALFNFRVFSVNFDGLNFKIQNAPKEKIAEKIKKYENSPENKKKLRLNWLAKEDNAKKRKMGLKKWRKENKNHIREYNSKYTKSRRSVDDNFRIRMNLRTRIRLALKGRIKSGSLEDLLGCSIVDFKKHIESMWDDKMNWKNYGSQNGKIHEGWHTDHIVACSKFDLSDPEQQKICFHYTNLQPMWGSENFKKGCR